MSRINIPAERDAEIAEDEFGRRATKGQVAALERAVLDDVRAKGGSERLLKIEIAEYTPDYPKALP